MSEYLSSEPEKSEFIEQLREIVDQYLESSDDTEFLIDLDAEDQLGYIYGRLIESNLDPDFIFQEFGIVESSDVDEVDFIMSDIDASAETLGEISNYPEAFSKVIEIINKEYGSEV